MTETIKAAIEKLTGQSIPLQENLYILENLKPESLELGYSQFNELLLFLGYDRISQSFFQFLVDGTIEYRPESVIKNLNDFLRQINSIIQFSLVLYGNIKFGFKQLSIESNEEVFEEWFGLFQPIPESYYKDRHLPLVPLDKINNDDTYLLGYIIQREIKERLEKNSNDQEALKMNTRMEQVIEKGKQNHKAYLASDHMDVYVATSMRQRHEYLFISRIAEQIFNDQSLKDLNVRYFDPTQAYCSDRIDKGIAEALMLKRAKCTIYLAQESDTLGKDSELASTLAQGKTVIAFVPKGDRAYVDKLLEDLSMLNPGKSPKEIILEQLRIFNPDLCWINVQLRNWMDDTGSDISFGKDLLYKSVMDKYNSRAQTLKDTHPLGIQVNLETGVANGVIVTREISECATLVRKVLLRKLEFDVVDEVRGGIPYVLLKESITKSVYRVSTGEKLLANTFWNYYLPK